MYYTQNNMEHSFRKICFWTTYVIPYGFTWIHLFSLLYHICFSLSIITILFKISIASIIEIITWKVKLSIVEIMTTGISFRYKWKIKKNCDYFCNFVWYIFFCMKNINKYVFCFCMRSCKFCTMLYFCICMKRWHGNLTSFYNACFSFIHLVISDIMFRFKYS